MYAMQKIAYTQGNLENYATWYPWLAHNSVMLATTVSSLGKHTLALNIFFKKTSFYLPFIVITIPMYQTQDPAFYN